MLTNSLFNCSEPSPSRALSKWIWIAFSLTLISLGTSNTYGQSDELSIETPSDYVFGTWTTGSLSQTTLSCVVAVRGGKTKNYKTKVVNVDTGDGFYLYRNGVTSSTGNERIEVTFEHTDTLQGSNPYELLYHDNYESQPHTGQDQGCPNGDNSSLKVSISASELSGKLGGDYIGYFDQVIRESSLEASTMQAFAVEVTVGAVAQVQISHLDGISFGQYGSTGDLSADEHFCVHSSAANGAYRLSVSSNNQASGNFFMVDSSINASIPMAVLFSASGSGSGTIPMTSNSVSATGDSSSTDCSGGDNATLTMSLTEADLLAAKTGSYVETLIIFVEPE